MEILRRALLARVVLETQTHKYGGADKGEKLGENRLSPKCESLSMFYLSYDLTRKAGLGVLHATQLIGHAARLLYFGCYGRYEVNICGSILD